MKYYQRSSLSEFLDDHVVYRNLEPVDKRLPALSVIRKKIGLASGYVPRKTSPEYARVIAELLDSARKINHYRLPLQRVVFIGDTMMNDGIAFANICKAGEWRGMAFIGSENRQPESLETFNRENGLIFLSNRWHALSRFDDIIQGYGFVVDEQTVVILDLDKTAIGARGRNHKVIDKVRVEAGFSTAEDLLGSRFDPEKFRVAYDQLNQPDFHPFTVDNQDYLVYICLMINSGVIELTQLMDNIGAENNYGLDDFIAVVNEHESDLSPRLLEAHQRFYQCWQQGDPTPLKDFRYYEFKNTADRMGNLDDGVSIEQMLSEEIVITHEVRERALAWRDRGAVILGLSDKPDEASLPTEAAAKQGYQAIHRIVTHVVGE